MTNTNTVPSSAPVPPAPPVTNTNTVLFAVVVDGYMHEERFATREEADAWTASDEHDDGEFDEYEVVEVCE